MHDPFSSPDCDKTEELETKIKSLEEKLKATEEERDQLTKTIDDTEAERDEEIKIIQDVSDGDDCYVGRRSEGDLRFRM